MRRSGALAPGDHGAHKILAMLPAAPQHAQDVQRHQPVSGVGEEFMRFYV